VDDTVHFGDIMLNPGARFETIPVSEATDRITDIDRDFEMSGWFPGASLSYKFDENFAAFANANSSFRAPQTWSYDFSVKEQDLDFETGANYEIGTRVVDLAGVSGNVALWLVNFSDFIDYDPDTDVYTNLGSYTSHGVDVTFEVGDSAWHIDVAGTIKNLFDKEVYLIHAVNAYVAGAPREFFLSASAIFSF
jgi:outer membrane receptor for Fe3+-dicitrate